jgi:hypothetical protein
MEVVTQRENLLRGNGITARRARQTHCIHGHELSGDNLYLHKKGRQCKTCRRAIEERRVR